MSAQEKLESELAYFKERLRVSPPATLTFYSGVVYGLMTALEVLQRCSK